VVWQHGRTGSVGVVPEDNLALTCASHTRFVRAASLQAGDTAMEGCGNIQDLTFASLLCLLASTEK
jgi:hypothetical protein